MLSASGCGHSERQGAEGAVTLDDKPLAKGRITFRPLAGTASPSAGAEVLDGTFSVGARGGLLPGRFRVEITAMRPTNKTRRDHFTGKIVTLEEQFIPAKFNSESQLEAVVAANGPNRFAFKLTSK
jgi:hypothetical protein